MFDLVRFMTSLSDGKTGFLPNTLIADQPTHPVNAEKLALKDLKKPAK